MAQVEDEDLSDSRHGGKQAEADYSSEMFNKKWEV